MCLLSNIIQPNYTIYCYSTIYIISILYQTILLKQSVIIDVFLLTYDETFQLLLIYLRSEVLNDNEHII